MLLSWSVEGEDEGNSVFSYSGTFDAGFSGLVETIERKSAFGV